MLQGLGAIIEALGGKIPDAFKKASESGVKASSTIKGAVDGVNVSVDQTSTKLKDGSSWTAYARAGVLAGTTAQKAVQGVTSAIGSVQSQLSSTDWDGWSQEAVDAAQAAEDAINGVSMGHSPGGIKEIPLKLAEARAAFREFQKSGVLSAERVQAAIDAMSGASMGAANFAAPGLTSAAASASGGDNYSFDISLSALDMNGAGQLIENTLLPGIVNVLRKGGRNKTDMQGVLR
jgi:hypothetical protein